ncbi:glycosyltransferase family 4 protein [Brachybacterium sp. AOP29-B2-41]|uniref:glycosyltransferase family 4 protein n=1 Tax=Brachybacterium sp. AOP29-B2-41 TaxID=3457704 RepID=UPI0040347B20
MRIAIIGHNLWGVGGTVRTIYNLAEGLGSEHEVELISVYQRTAGAAFELPAGTTRIALVDGRPGSEDRRSDAYFRPSSEIPPTEELYSQYSELSDARIREYLQHCSADVIIGTRPSLNLLVARFAPCTAVRIAQEHTGHQHIDEPTREQMRVDYGAFDSIVTVTETDAKLVRESLRLPRTPVIAIPNSIPVPEIPLSDGESKLVIAAGRVEPAKRFELLVHAFAALADDFPEWNVRIYGSGSSIPELRRLIQAYDLTDRIRLMGSVQNMRDEWTKASIAVSTSDAESFGMTLVEAMRAGVPLISTDCPVGPQEILHDGVDSVLVPTGDAPSLSTALKELMGSEGTRRALAQAGVSRGADFDVKTIARRHLALFNEHRRPQLARALRSMWKGGLRKSQHHPDVTTVTAIGQVGGALRISIERPASARSILATLEMTSSHAADRPVEFPIFGRTQEFSISPDAFGNDALWTIRLISEESRPGPVVFRVDNRELLYTEVPQGRTKQVVPYITGEVLRARAWKRNRHTEVRAVSVRESGIHITAEASFPLSTSGRIVLTRRNDNTELDAERPSFSLGSENILQFGVPALALATERIYTHEDWVVTYRDEYGDSKLARILDDLPAHKQIDSYQAWNTSDLTDDCTEDTGSIAIRPYFTPRQGLAISVVGH